MSFQPHKSEKQFAITIKSPSDNVVGHINLSPQFLKAVTGKQLETITTTDINGINNGDLLSYLTKMTLEITNPTTPKKINSIEEY